MLLLTLSVLLMPVVHPAVTHVAPNAIHANVRTAPSVEQPDGDSEFVVVDGVGAGARVDLYADGRWVGQAVARGLSVQVPLTRPLRVGAHVGALVRSATGTVATPFVVVVNDYLTYHGSKFRLGWNQFETELTVANVGGPNFGLLKSIPVDGNVYSQPLFVNNVTMPDSTKHNLLIVATENDTLYAFDAETGATLWQRSFIDPAHGITAIPSSSVSCHNIWPTIGINGTPVIAKTLKTIYLVTDTRETSPSGVTFHHRLHAVDFTTGLDKAGSPVEVTGTARMNDGSTITLNAQWQMNRPSLLISSNTLYVGMGAHCSQMRPIAHGWLFAYDLNSLAQLASWNSATDISSSYLGSIWGLGFGPSSDSLGNVYFNVGDAPFDADTGGNNYGYSIMKMGPKLAVRDYFTPYYWAGLADNEIGSGGTMILPDQTGTFPHLLVTAGKTGAIFLVNRDHLGEFTPGGPDNVIQEITHAIGINHGVWGGGAYYNGPTGQFVYYVGDHDNLKAFQLFTSPTTHLALSMKSPDIFTGEGGSIPVVSSNGATPGTGIVWVTTRPDDIVNQPMMLRAYDATNLQNEIFQTSIGFWQNAMGNPPMTPTVIDGRVFVGTANTVQIFGLK